jgi:hypothetical protein
MSVDQWKRNRKWLDDRKDRYPHVCYTKKNSPRPQDVKAKVPQVEFIVAPLMKTAEWRFETAADMSLFKQAFVTLDNKL